MLRRSFVSLLIMKLALQASLMTSSRNIYEKSGTLLEMHNFYQCRATQIKLFHHTSHSSTRLDPILFTPRIYDSSPRSSHLHSLTSLFSHVIPYPQFFANPYIHNFFNCSEDLCLICLYPGWCCHTGHRSRRRRPGIVQQNRIINNDQ